MLPPRTHVKNFRFFQVLNRKKKAGFLSVRSLFIPLVSRCSLVVHLAFPHGFLTALFWLFLLLRSCFVCIWLHLVALLTALFWFFLGVRSGFGRILCPHKPKQFTVFLQPFDNTFANCPPYSRRRFYKPSASRIMGVFRHGQCHT